MDPMTAFCLVGSRGPVRYAESTAMPGAADTYLYPKELITPPHIGFLDMERDRCTTTNFTKSLMMPKKMTVINVSDMIIRNLEIAEKKSKTAV
jgi:hypothetical protein